MRVTKKKNVENDSDIVDKKDPGLKNTYHVHRTTVKAATDIYISCFVQCYCLHVRHELFIDNETLLMTDLRVICAMDIACDEVRSFGFVSSVPSFTRFIEGTWEARRQLETEREGILTRQAIILERVNRDAHVKETK